MYQVGDKVRIHSKEWFEEHYIKENSGYRNVNSCCSYINGDMLEFCSKVVTIREIVINYSDIYKIEEDDTWSWSDWMFAGKVEENKEEAEERVGNSDIIRDLCDYLGISVGQVIISKDNGYKYRLTETNGLEVYEYGEWKVCCSFTFNTFIKMIKEYKFVTKWTPNVGDRIYFMSLACSDLWSYGTYDGTEHDKKMVAKGLYFRTQEEAIECAKKFLAQQEEGK